MALRVERVQGSGLARRACCPLIAGESSTRQLGVRSGGAAHKNQKRRGVLIELRAHRHFERSRGALLQNVHRLI